MATNSTSSAVPDIRDIKPPIEMAGGMAWLWWVLVVAGLGIVAWLLWRRWRHRDSIVVGPPPVPAHVRARQKLQEALALIAQPKPFVIAVSDTARAYLEERFNFHAPERTTEEFLRELAGTRMLLPDQKESLGRFLESCDLVKFAKYEPGENELRVLHGSAVRLVAETEPAPAAEGRQEPENHDPPAGSAAVAEPPPIADRST
jgi:hypothetical protein